MRTDSIEGIEELCKFFARSRDVLAERLTAFRDEVETIKRRKLAGIRSALADMKAMHGDLVAAVEANPQLFTKPKSRVMHAVKVGFAKQRGKVSFEDADQVVKLIEKHLPDRAGALLNITKKPDKAALAELTGAELKRIGVTVDSDTDAAFAKPIDDDLQKLIKALLGDDEEEEVLP